MMHDRDKIGLVQFRWGFFSHDPSIPIIGKLSHRSSGSLQEVTESVIASLRIVPMRRSRGRIEGEKSVLLLASKNGSA
jgi:hypothetical protein